MRLNQFFPAFSRLARRLGPGLAVLALALPLAWAVATTATLPPPAWAQDNTPQPATPGTPTPEPGTPATPTPTPTPEPIDYDADDDLQIEVTTLEQLNALRYDLNGDGVVDWPDGKRPNKNRKNEGDAREPGGSGALIYAGAFPNAAENMGCESACRGYELAADLTFDSNGDNAITAADGKLSWNNGAGWTPIGSTDAPYNARFQGNGHTIAHLFIDNRDAWEVGLFGVNSGEVREVGLTDAQVSGAVSDKYIGGLVGYNNRGEVDLSYVTGAVTAAGNNPAVGGLVGYNNRGFITRSYADATVSSPGYKSRVGGLVGENNRGNIEKSYAAGDVRVTHGTSGAGGLVGYNNRGIIFTSSASGDVSGVRAGEIIRIGGLMGKSIYGLITESYATGSVTGNGRLVVAGGLAGSADWAIVRACYASGAVSATGTDHASVGGLIGSFLGGDPLGGLIEACYATGQVSHAAPELPFPGPGGLVGIFFGDDNGADEVAYSYWDTQTSGQTVSGAGTGKTTDELVSPVDYTGIYGEWNLHLDDDGIADFPWYFGDDDDYPELRHAYPLNQAAASSLGGPA